MTCPSKAPSPWGVAGVLAGGCWGQLAVANLEPEAAARLGLGKRPSEDLRRGEVQLGLLRERCPALPPCPGTLPDLA